MKFVLATTLLCSFFLQDNAQDLREAAASPVEMVVTANNLATDAGKKILAAGGTAVDAMIAIQTVLGLVEPQSTGLAGGAFVVYYDADAGKLTTFDAREKAPAEATEGRYIDTDGNSLGFYDAWQSALSVGVPGVPRMMEDLHGKFGKVPWADLFEDAKTLALEGFALTQRTEDNANELLGRNPSCDDRLFFRDPVAFEFFVNSDCTAKPAGTFVTNPEYADTLDILASGGADAFYTGAVAEDIIAKIAGDRKPTDDPIISLQDLINYEMLEREPVCKSYRETYNVCGMGPPSSGALAVGQILGVLENFDLSSYEAQDVDTVHLFTQAMRMAFADRNLYVGDSDFVTVPVEGMLDEAYLQERAGLIDMTFDMGTASPGTPPGDFDTSAPQLRTFEGGTSHVSIVDQFGNALSMTTTVESYFGLQISRSKLPTKLAPQLLIGCSPTSGPVAPCRPPSS
jgi:gamma-glutamyltranspeptidase/glutathione hydrolase